MILEVVYGWKTKSEDKLGKLSKQLNLSSDSIKDLEGCTFSEPYEHLNDTDAIKYPELCIFNAGNKNIEYFGLKVFEGTTNKFVESNMRFEDASEYSRNLFCLLEENGWHVSYLNGKPMLYIIMTEYTLKL